MTLKKMLKTVTKLQNKSWEDHWKTRNLTWDAGKASPALIEIIDDLKIGKWLIPGCGYGYDVLEFSKRGHYATGLDLSPTCIDLCNKKYPKVHNFEFVCGDFFKHTKVYDGVYDYTFFCALPIELRKDWGMKMSELVKTNGTLITLMFPIDNHEGGPPFSVTPEDYEQVVSNRDWGKKNWEYGSKYEPLNRINYEKNKCPREFSNRLCTARADGLAIVAGLPIGDAFSAINSGCSHRASYEMVHGNLEIIVIEAKNLKSSLTDKTDPYVSLTIGGKKQKTTTKSNAGKQADFNEKFQFDIFDGVQELYLEVWDEDTGKDDLRGSKVIDLQTVFDKKTQDASFSLTHKDKHAGDVKLVMYFTPRK